MKNLIIQYVFAILYLGYSFMDLRRGGGRDAKRLGYARRQMLLTTSSFICLCLAKGNDVELLDYGLFVLDLVVLSLSAHSCRLHT